MARFLYFQSKVPIHFWNECVLAATFFINPIPSPVLQFSYLFEVFWNECVLTATFFIYPIPSPVLQLNYLFGLLYGSPVDYSLFCTFGCLSFVSTRPCHRLKFHPRARICVFLGYQSGIKGYKLFDLVNKHMFFSRDVIFHEDVFLFHSISCSGSLINRFLG